MFIPCNLTRILALPISMSRPKIETPKSWVVVHALTTSFPPDPIVQHRSNFLLSLPLTPLSRGPFPFSFPLTRRSLPSACAHASQVGRGKEGMHYYKKHVPKTGRSNGSGTVKGRTKLYYISKIFSGVRGNYGAVRGRGCTLASRKKSKGGS